MKCPCGCGVSVVDLDELRADACITTQQSICMVGNLGTMQALTRKKMCEIKKRHLFSATFLSERHYVTLC